MQITIQRRCVITRWAAGAVGIAGVGATFAQIGDSALLGTLPIVAAVVGWIVQRYGSQPLAGLVLVAGCVLAPLQGAFNPLAGHAVIAELMWFTVGVLLAAFVLPLRMFVVTATVTLGLELAAMWTNPTIPVPVAIYLNGFFILLAVVSGVSLRFVEKQDLQSEQKQMALEKALNQARKRAEELEQTRLCLKETRSQLIHMGRLVSLGELSAEVAHELNNPLTTVLMSAEYLRDELTEKHPDLACTADDVYAAAKACSSVTERVLWFGRRYEQKRVPVATSVLIERAVSIVRGPLRRGRSELQIDLSEDVVICGDTVQLTQVLVNLILNAGSVMPEGGRVRLQVERKGSHVRMVLEDEGPGVPAELAERIFIPFFSTRTENGGTGLGLAISRDVVEAHGGRLTLETRSPAPARFCIELPQHEAVSGEAAHAQAG